MKLGCCVETSMLKLIWFLFYLAYKDALKNWYFFMKNDLTIALIMVCPYSICTRIKFSWKTCIAKCYFGKFFISCNFCLLNKIEYSLFFFFFFFFFRWIRWIWKELLLTKVTPKVIPRKGIDYFGVNFSSWTSKFQNFAWNGNLELDIKKRKKVLGEHCLKGTLGMACKAWNRSIN